ncbi:MAG: suppressor of fused domain protein [Clostridia bacterium]|nr:suppressor of fused domain protein [Clostridia bacterium]
MLDLKQVQSLSEHYAKMFDTTTENAGAITENNIKNMTGPPTIIFVGMPTEDKPYYKLGTIGMSDIKQRHTSTPYTELVMTLPKDWQFNTNDTKWDWPINILKTAAKSPYLIKKPFTYYGSFAINESFETFDKSTDKCSVIFTPLAQFDHKKFGKLKVGGKKIHFMQILAANEYTYHALDKPNRVELVNKLVASDKYDFTVH